MFNTKTETQQVPQKSISHFKILRARRVKWKKFHFDDPKISDVTGPFQYEIICEYWILNCVERNTGGSIWGNIPAFFQN